MIGNAALSGAALSGVPSSSDRPSVPCLPFSRNRKPVETFNLVQTWVPCPQTRIIKDQIWGLKVKGQGLWERKWSFFAHILVKKWINLRQTKTKMISGPFYTYRRIGLYFASGNDQFLPRDATKSAVLLRQVVSICLSVRDGRSHTCDHILWNSSKII